MPYGVELSRVILERGVNPSLFSVNSHLNIYEFVDVLFSVENELGRVRNKKNDPRTCDIDIIDYNKMVIKKKLVLPHPLMSSRNFVLLPLYEIDKTWKHPKTDINIVKLIKSLPIKDLRSIKQIWINVIISYA